MAALINIYRLEDWLRLWLGSAPVMLLKHSTYCGTSARALQQFQAWAATLPPGSRVVPALVRVVEERPLSQRIAQDTGVPHASPQVLLVQGGRVRWQASQWGITQPALAAAAAAVGG